MSTDTLIPILKEIFIDESSTKAPLVNTQTIKEWLTQFPKHIHHFLLTETITIFKHSYYSNKRIESLLSKFLLLLKEKEGNSVFDKITPMPVHNMKNKAHIEYCALLSKLLSAKKINKNTPKSEYPVFYYLNDFIDDEKIQRDQIQHFMNNTELSSSTRVYVFSITHDPYENRKEWDNLLLKEQEKYIDIVFTPVNTPKAYHSSKKARLLFSKIEMEYGPEANSNYNNYCTYLGVNKNLASIFTSAKNNWVPLFN